MALYISLLVLTLLNKMVLQRERTGNWLRLTIPYCLASMYRSIDAILTTCFLINRMSSSSLNNKVPYSIIYPNDILFHVTLHVLDCICFVHDVCPRLDKLYVRVIKCVFLGYS